VRDVDYSQTIKSIVSKFARPLRKEQASYKALIEQVRKSQSFAALKGKTQIHLDLSDDITPDGRQSAFDRSVHTEIVAGDSCQMVYQMQETIDDSRELAEKLGLNAELAELIALSHDCGHTPGGHTGEKAIQEILPEFGHPPQAIINLGLEGIELPSKVALAVKMHGEDEFVGENHIEGTFYAKPNHNSDTCREGIIVQIADNTSSTLHDMKDLIETKLLTLEKMQANKEMKRLLATVKNRDGKSITVEDIFHRTDETLVDIRKHLLSEVAKHSSIIDGKLNISMGDEATNFMFKLRKENYKMFRIEPRIMAQDELIRDNIKSCYNRFQQNPKFLYDSLEKKLMHSLNEDVKKARLNGNMTSKQKAGFEQRRREIYNRINELKQQPIARQFSTTYAMCTDKEINNFVYEISGVQSRHSLNIRQQIKEVSAQRQSEELLPKPQQLVPTQPKIKPSGTVL